MRLHYKNGGDLLELAEYQRHRKPKAAGCENDTFTLTVTNPIKRQETSQELRKYFDVMQVYVPETAKNMHGLRHTNGFGKKLYRNHFL